MSVDSQNLIGIVNEPDIQSLFFSTLLVYPENNKFESYKKIIEPFVGELFVSHNAQETLEILENEFLELIILSLDLTDISAVSLLSTIQHYRPGLPVLVIANQNTLMVALNALREGAWDYVLEEENDIFSDTIKKSFYRMAERKLSLYRDTSMRSERFAFWSAVQRAQDGLAIIGSSGNVSFANPCFQNFVHLLGGKIDQDKPIDMVRLLSQYDQHLADQLYSALKANKSGDSVWRSELKFTHTSELEDKVTRYFKLILSSISLSGNEVANSDGKRHVLWISDITRIKEHEQFQREIISTTSHDLKGPLATISCAAEMILECNDSHDDNTLKLLKLITNAAKKSQDHIEEFLSAKRIEAGVLTVEPYEYILNDVLNEIVQEYSMNAQSKSIKLNLDQPDSIILIYADKLALNRILGNLISNAIKFTQESGEINISAEVKSAHIKVSVTDNGPGIGQDALHTLFDRYSRLKEHHAIEGSGLGLFIVKSIMEAHGGRVEVQSELGKGTSFHLYFPIKEKI